MPTTETTNRRLLKIASGSTEDWSVHYNSTIDLLDRPVVDYRITAAENLATGDVAVIKDDGTGAKKAYLAASGAVTMGDPLGVATETVLAGSPIRLTLSGAVTNLAWAFGPTDTTAYLSASGTVTMTDTGFPLGPVIGIDTFYLGASSAGGGGGGQTNTVVGASGVTNTGTNIDAVLAPTYGSIAGTVCQGNDTRLHTQNSDLGTSATSFEINYLGNSARILTSNLTGNRDITFPDATTLLLGAANNLGDVGDVATARTNLALPATLTANHFMRVNAGGTAMEGQSFPYAVATDASGPSILNGTWTTLASWSAESGMDPFGIVGASGITPGVAGIYAISSTITYTSMTDQAQIYIAPALNGTFANYLAVHQSSGTGLTSRAFVVIRPLTATDLVSVATYQGSGTTRTLATSAIYNHLSLWRIA